MWTCLAFWLSNASRWVLNFCDSSRPFVGDCLTPNCFTVLPVWSRAWMLNEQVAVAASGYKYLLAAAGTCSSDSGCVPTTEGSIIATSAMSLKSSTLYTFVSAVPSMLATNGCCTMLCLQLSCCPVLCCCLVTVPETPCSCLTWPVLWSTAACRPVQTHCATVHLLSLCPS